MDLVGWLRSLGLERYEAAFRKSEIDERILPTLTRDDLKEIGVSSAGHRLILLDAIAILRAMVGSTPRLYGKALRALATNGRGRFWIRRSTAARMLDPDRVKTSLPERLPQ